VSTILGQRAGFGVVQGLGTTDPERLAHDARLAEALGFDMFCLADHLHGDRPTVEPWTALTWVAAATTTIEVMPNVLGLPYRAPAVTAKMAETLDRLSAGRLVLGLGTGGYDAEFTAFGLAERTPRQKVDALAEALRITKGLWNEPVFSYEGAHFSVREARVEPKPQHQIPVWLGSYGPRSLRLAGALADGWIPSLGRIGLDRLRVMRAEVRGAAEAAGRDPDEITCAVNLVVTFDATADQDAASAAASSGMVWRPVSGNSETIAERLIEVAQAGFTFFNLIPNGPRCLERFAAEVMPVVRREAAL
jgi:alkanesulfonate monooxygenase SsuD/methylene tetrahydromethanopterin reductase-like flavin-dependent oxidoreductase (luciferase family)